MFFTLALVPTSAIPTCLAMILSAVPDDADCMTLYAYFENQWTVTMPPDMWNSYSDSEDRTTNRVEEFHSKLNKAYPNIHVLINVFKKLEAKYEILNYNLRNREQFTLANRFTSEQILFKKSRTNSKANSLHMLTKNESPFCEQIPF